MILELKINSMLKIVLIEEIYPPLALEISPLALRAPNLLFPILTYLTTTSLPNKGKIFVNLISIRLFFLLQLKDFL